MFNNVFYYLPIMTLLKQVNQNISAKTPDGCEEYYNLAPIGYNYVYV